MSISILIPSFNCKDKLFRLLDSIKNSDYKNYEVIVIDNGSKDSTLKVGEKKYVWVKWYDAGQKNIGQTGCYNVGFALAKKGNHIMMIDSDVVVDKKMVGNLTKKLESGKDIGIVTPMVLYLSDKNWVNQAGANVNLFTGKVTVGWGRKDNYLNEKRVQNSGTVMIFKNDLVKKIGCFEDWFLCYFDPDYCLRAAKAGYECWYEPKAICYHDQPKDQKLWRPRVLGRAYLLGRNRTLFMRRHGNMVGYILFLPFLFGYYLKESITFGIINKWFQLVWGTFVGFYYPLSRSNRVAFPKLSQK